MDEARVALALDVGAHRLVAGYVDENGRVLCEKRYTYAKDGDVMKTIIAAVTAVQAAWPMIDADMIGATLCGECNAATGRWTDAGFGGIREVDFAGTLFKAFGLPVTVSRESHACALAEGMFGCCLGVRDYIWLFLSNQVDAALCLGGKLYTGAHGGAGRLAHVVVEDAPDARLCGCGSTGCLGMYLSGEGIVKSYIGLGGDLMVAGDAVSAKGIDALARDGDAAATLVYRKAGVYLGRALAAGVAALNPRKIVLGGPIALGYDLFRDTLLKTVDDSVHARVNSGLSVEQSTLGPNASLLGAAAAAFARQDV